MSDIKIVDQNDKPVVQQSGESHDPQGQTMMAGEIVTQSFASMFDLKASEIPRYKSKIDILVDYAKSKTKDHSLDNLKWAVRSLSLKLGTPPLGEKLINYLAHYAYLEKQKDKIDSEIKNYTYGIDS